uniref:Uncharacterized protein n=1 Tax=Arundo donax TaxID=35708 RepID=A0A0A9CRC0_ARUDO
MSHWRIGPIRTNLIFLLFSVPIIICASVSIYSCRIKLVLRSMIC